VIVDDFHVVGITVVPDEADAVLIVDPNTVLATSVARERLEPITGERRQVAKFASRVELLQFSLGDPSHFLEAPAEPAGKERLDFGVFERPNHSRIRV
jgi:hypothetical protein